MPNKVRPRDETGKHAVKNCGGTCTEWNYNTIGGDIFFHKSNPQTKSVTPMSENELGIMKPIRCHP
jgi:hypothetical protein